MPKKKKKTKKRQLLAKKEVDIQKEILEFLWTKGIFAWRNNTFSVYDSKTGTFRKKSKYELLGVSDILGIYEGRPLAIEVKSQIGVLSENQSDFLKRFKENQGIAFMARSVKDTKKALGFKEEENELNAEEA